MAKVQKELTEEIYKLHGLKVIGAGDGLGKNKDILDIREMFNDDKNLRFILKKLDGSPKHFDFKKQGNGDITFNLPKKSKKSKKEIVVTFDMYCKDTPLECISIEVDSGDSIYDIVEGYTHSFKIKTLTPELEEKIKNKYRLRIATMAGDFLNLETRQNDMVINFDNRDINNLEINEKGDDIVINHRGSLYAIGQSKKYTKALVSFSSPSVAFYTKVPFNVPLDKLMMKWYKKQNINRLKFKVYLMFSFLSSKTLPNKVSNIILKKYFQGKYLWERLEKKHRKFDKKFNKKLEKQNREKKEK